MDKNLKRQLSGTAFLSLEHWAYIILVVLIPVLFLAGFDAAMAIWTNRTNEAAAFMGVMNISPTRVDVTMAIGIAASLLVLAPLLYVLRHRTHAEMLKRPGYQDRLVYKLPIYGALCVLAAFLVAVFITLIAAVMHSLALIGVKGADIGGIYTTQFLPALVVGVVIAAVSWYVVKLAKGRDWGSQFSFVMVWVSALMIVTLFTTAIMATHNPKNQETDRMPIEAGPGLNYDSWLE